jgi:NADH-quinone oxidoreductase subunit K
MLSEIFLEIGLAHYLVLSAFLFCAGLFGALLKKNVLVVLSCVELMLNGVNISFVAFSKYLNVLDGQVLVFFVMTIAAAEAAVGLALLVAIFKRYKEVQMKFFEFLRG